MRSTRTIHAPSIMRTHFRRLAPSRRSSWSLMNRRSSIFWYSFRPFIARNAAWWTRDEYNASVSAKTCNDPVWLLPKKTQEDQDVFPS